MKSQDINKPEATPAIDVDRRATMTRLGGLALTAGLVQSGDVFAMSDANEKKISQTASEHPRAQSHPAEAFILPRWIPAKTGNFDLTKPIDNHYAFAKVQANLAGEYTWLAEYGWILIAPPGKPAYPFLGRMTAARVFVTPANSSWAPNIGEHDYTMWGTFTTSHFDPRDFSPVSRILNPYIGKMIDVPTFHFADRLSYRLGQSIVVPDVDPKFYDQPWDRDGGYSPHFINAGQNITYTVLGSSQFDGPHQPRCDVGFWTVKAQELMDPALRSIDTHRDYSVIQKMSEYAWYGVEKGDPAQILVHLTGMKTQDPKRLPDLIRKNLLEKNKDRFF
ncbi:MAG: hypothetical protein SFV19_04260 [Rhodospirillaceae bacterium]|nr:hypothetical protein [Rhodospirillaceae bacterium]